MSTVIDLKKYYPVMLITALLQSALSKISGRSASSRESMLSVRDLVNFMKMVGVTEHLVEGKLLTTRTDVAFRNN